MVGAVGLRGLVGDPRMRRARYEAMKETGRHIDQGGVILAQFKADMLAIGGRPFPDIHRDIKNGPGDHAHQLPLRLRRDLAMKAAQSASLRRIGQIVLNELLIKAGVRQTVLRPSLAKPAARVENSIGAKPENPVDLKVFNLHGTLASWLGMEHLPSSKRLPTLLDDAADRSFDPERNFMSQATLKADQAPTLIGAMQRTLDLELAGLSTLKDALGDAELEAIRLIATLKGRLICTGVGKSGHVARKIAATLASTGTPSQYVHPSEASHGDLGMITADDAVLALSKSGETRELGDVVAYCRRFAVPLIAMTAGANSTLAKGADLVLRLPEAEEACGETRAPTTSTTMMIAYGDALAVALIEARGFTAKDFARFHPGGALGSALARVDSLMHSGDALPLVRTDAVMGQALIVMSEKGFGCVGVIGAERRLAGIVTDGDLRRKMGPGFTEANVADVMTADPVTVTRDLLASDALRQMTAGNRKITQLFVCDDAKRPVGLLHIHDLLRAGVS